MLKRIRGFLIGGFIFMIATIAVAGEIDREGPEFVSITISPETVNAAIADGMPKVSVHARDDLSGVGIIQIAFVSLNDPKKGAHATMYSGHIVSGTLQDGVFANIVLIPKYSEPDEFVVWKILLHDQIGNETRVSDEIIKQLNIGFEVINTIETQFMPLVVNP